MSKHTKTNISIFNSKELNVFYGIPNCYTSYSLGIANLYDALHYSYHNNLDFLITTDQNDLLAQNSSYDKNNKSKWLSAQSLGKKFMKKRENFVYLLGFEGKTTSYGNIDIINSNTFFTGEIKDINLLIFWMLNNPNAFIIIKRPIKTTLSIPYSKILNSMITSIEVCYGTFGNRYSRREKYYFSLLDAGWKLGAVNSQNNKKLDFGDYDNLTGVIIPKLTKNNLIEAFRKRRTFSSESRSLNFYFLANDTLMGGVLPSYCEKIKFSIIAEDKNYPIEKIEIIKNHGKIVHTLININLSKIKYLYEHTLENDESWFLIKIYQNDDRIAISSPIFVH